MSIDNVNPRLQAVKEIESGKSPLAKRAIMLELVPPGQATNIINPMAIKGSGLNKTHNPNPTRGSKMI